MCARTQAGHHQGGGSWGEAEGEERSSIWWKVGAAKGNQKRQEGKQNAREHWRERAATNEKAAFLPSVRVGRGSLANADDNTQENGRGGKGRELVANSNEKKLSPQKVTLDGIPEKE